MKALTDGRRALLNSAMDVVKGSDDDLGLEDVEARAFGVLCSSRDVLPLLNNLGCVLAATGKTDQAMAMFQEARRAASRARALLDLIDDNSATALRMSG